MLPVLRFCKFYPRGCAAGIAIIAIIAFVAVNTYMRIHAFIVEDRIHHAFYPVAAALCEFEDDHHVPAADLTQLVPRYIARFPKSCYADSVDYCVMDGGKAWQISILSSALSQRRVYCCRSTQKFTAEEERRIVQRYHSVWTVLSE